MLLALLTVIVGPVTAPATGAAAGPRSPGFLTTPEAGVIDASLTDLLVDVGSAGPASAFVHFADDVYVEGVTAIGDAGLTVGLDLPATHDAYAYGSGGSSSCCLGVPRWCAWRTRGSSPPSWRRPRWVTRARTCTSRPVGWTSGCGTTTGTTWTGGCGNRHRRQWDRRHPPRPPVGRFGEPDPKTIKNFKVECTTPVLVNTATGQCFGPVIMQDVPDSDTTSGHGTHVALPNKRGSLLGMLR